MAVAVSHLDVGPEQCPLPAGSSPHLLGLLCPLGPVQLLDLPALMLSGAVSRLQDVHPVAMDHRWHPAYVPVVYQRVPWVYLQEQM